MVAHLIVNSLLNHVNHRRKLQVERIYYLRKWKGLETFSAMGFFVKRHHYFTITEILQNRMHGNGKFNIYIKSAGNNCSKPDITFVRHRRKR